MEPLRTARPAPEWAHGPFKMERRSLLNGVDPYPSRIEDPVTLANLQLRCRSAYEGIEVQLEPRGYARRSCTNQIGALKPFYRERAVRGVPRYKEVTRQRVPCSTLLRECAGRLGYSSRRTRLRWLASNRSVCRLRPPVQVRVEHSGNSNNDSSDDFAPDWVPPDCPKILKPSSTPLDHSLQDNSRHQNLLQNRTAVCLQSGTENGTRRGEWRQRATLSFCLRHGRIVGQEKRFDRNFAPAGS